MYIEEFSLMLENPIFHLFVMIIILDIITGTVKGIITKKGSSNIGLNGLIKHITNIVIVILLYPMMCKINMNFYVDSVVIFYIVFYAISNVENLYQIGIPFPEFIMDKLKIFYDDKNKKG